MNSWPAHLAVWWYGTILPCVRTTVLGCCRTGSGKGSLFLSSLTDHNEGWTPSHPAHCLHFMAAASDSSTRRKPFFLCFKRLFWVPVISCCADFPGRGRSSEAVIICCSSFLVLRDVSLKLWPNRWVLRTFSPSSSAAALSAAQTLAAAPEIQRAFLQNKITPPAPASTEIYEIVLIYLVFLVKTFFFKLR